MSSLLTQGAFLVNVAKAPRYATNSVSKDHHGASVHTDLESGWGTPGCLSV